MDATVVRVTLSLIGPGILLIFGIAFAATWSIDRKRPHLLHLAAACWTFTLGSASQILYLPPGTGPNALVSAPLYTCAVLLTAQGLLARTGKPASWRTGAAILAAFTLLIWYYLYVEPNLLARVYIQNFGYGLVLTATALRLRHLARGRPVDRLLFWVLLAFALQFFPRTLLTIGFSAPTDVQAFANSVFWQALQLSLAVLGTALALAMLAACVSDIIDDLRLERDIDGLTGLLNRRAFQERVQAHLSRDRRRGALVLCDIDRFKPINDVYGHDAGDRVLQRIAGVISRSVRKVDIAGRLGGEEFGVFLAGAGPAEARAYAMRLKDAIAACELVLGGEVERVTASFGVCGTRSSDGWEALYRRADALLYQAKRDGRDRVVAKMD